MFGNVSYISLFLLNVLYPKSIESLIIRITLKKNFN